MEHMPSDQGLFFRHWVFAAFTLWEPQIGDSHPVPGVLSFLPAASSALTHSMTLANSAK